MFKKSTAVTGFTFGLVSATDGSAITDGTVTGYYTLDGGAQGTLLGTAVHQGNGQWSINLSAAEMNGDIVGLFFTHASAINASFTIKTDTALVSEVKAETASILADTGELQTDLTDGGRIDLLIDGIKGKTDSLTFTVANQVDSNAIAISGGTGAADNLEAMYDGTGYIDATAPASRDQLARIVVTGSAVNVAAIAAPNGFVLENGREELNDEDFTHALDGIYHQLDDQDGSPNILQGYYKFDIGGDGVPTSVTITGIFSGANDNFLIQVNTGSSGTPNWSTRGTINGTNSLANEVHTFNLFAEDIVTDVVGGVWVRINGTGLTSPQFDVDQIFVSKAVVSRTVGYALGSIWVDSAGNSGTELYVNGTADNPCPWADAVTISATLGIKKFQVASGNTVTLTGNSDNYEITGYAASVALAGQSIEGANFYGLTISGTGVTTTNEPHFIDCEFDSAVTLGPSHFIRCGFGNTLTMGSPGNFFVVDGYSKVAGGGTPAISMGVAIGASNLSIRRWGGGLSLIDIESGDSISAEATVGGVLTLTGAAGSTVEVRGGWKTVSSGSFAGTLNDFSVNKFFTDIKGSTFDTLTDSLEAIRDNTGTAGAALTDLGGMSTGMKAEVNAEVDTALATTTYAEHAGVPAATASLEEKITWLYMLARNKLIQTSALATLRNDTDTGDVATAGTTDNGTTATRDEWV